MASCNVLIGVFLGVGNYRRIALFVSGGSAGGCAVIIWEDRGSGLFPLGLLCVDVDIKPGAQLLATNMRWRMKVTLPFLVLFVPSRGPSGRDIGGLGRRRTSWGSEIVHRSEVLDICDLENSCI